MFINRRFDQILKLIREQPNMSIHQISCAFNLTERTIRNDISAMNRILADHGAQIVAVRGRGYHLDVKDREGFDCFFSETNNHVAFDSLMSREQRERATIRALLLSEGPLTYDEICDSVGVGYDTARSYLRHARSVLKTYGLTCVSRRDLGILVFGREEDRRRCLAAEAIPSEFGYDCLNLLAGGRDVFPDIDIDDFVPIIKVALESAGLALSDSGFREILVCAGIMAERVVGRHPVEASDEDVDSAAAEIASNSICDSLEVALDIRIDEQERQFLYRCVLANTDAMPPQVDKELIDAGVMHALALIYTDYGIDLRDDETLRKNLNSHLASIFLNRILGVNRKNALLSTIKQSFPLPYDIALATMSHAFSSEPYLLDEDEMGYVALHIGAAMERIDHSNARVYSIAVVCPDERAVRKLLEARISTLFGKRLRIQRSMTVREFSECDQNESCSWDLVISTAPLVNVEIPVVMVNWQLKTQDAQAISRWIEARDKETSGTSFAAGAFSAKSFFVVDKPVERQELLKQMCMQLEAEGIAQGTGCLYASVLAREGLAGTAIDETVVIPHPLKPCTKTNRISIALLRNPLYWDDSHPSIRLVMLLAIRPGSRDEMESLYGFLMNIITDKKLQRRILTTSDFASFMAVMGLDSAE